MIRVLITLRDPILCDLVVTAFKQFPSISTYRLPEYRAAEMIQTGEYDAVVLDLIKGDEAKQGIVHEIRSVSKNIEIIGLVDRGLKEKFNRFKLEHSVFSVFPLPIEPFALAKNISRLEASLKKSMATR